MMEARWRHNAKEYSVRSPAFIRPECCGKRKRELGRCMLGLSESVTEQRRAQRKLNSLKNIRKEFNKIS